MVVVWATRAIKPPAAGAGERGVAAREPHIEQRAKQEDEEEEWHKTLCWRFGGVFGPMIRAGIVR